MKWKQKGRKLDMKTSFVLFCSVFISGLREPRFLCKRSSGVSFEVTVIPTHQGFDDLRCHLPAGWM